MLMYALFLNTSENFLSCVVSLLVGGRQQPAAAQQASSAAESVGVTVGAERGLLATDAAEAAEAAEAADLHRGKLWRRAALRRRHCHHQDDDDYQAPVLRPVPRALLNDWRTATSGRCPGCRQ